MTLEQMGEYEATLVEHYRDVHRRLWEPAATLPQAKQIRITRAAHVRRVLQQPTPREITENILREVCRKHSVKMAELTNIKICPIRVSMARWEAFYRLRHERKLSWAQIATLMGGFHHAAALRGARKHKMIKEQLTRGVDNTHHE